MGEMVQKWLLRRTGVVMSKQPELFAQQVSDGVLLAKVLHGYGVMDAENIACVRPSTDPRLKLSNMRYLKVWLNYVGVECDDEMLQEIAAGTGRGSAAATLFQQLFFCLEGKDRLHFIAQNVSSTPVSRFLVEKVSEATLPVTESSEEVNVIDTEFPCLGKDELATLYREQYQTILDECRGDLQDTMEMEIIDKFANLSKCSPEGLPPLWAKDEPQEQKPEDEAVQTEREEPELTLTASEEMKIKGVISSLYDTVTTKHRKSKVARRKPSRREITCSAFKQRMVRVILDELWETLLQKQEDKFDRLVTEQLLKQSQYEKKATSKLSSIRAQKQKMVENRLRVEKMLMERQQRDVDDAITQLQKSREEQEYLYNLEMQRNEELHQRISDEKMRNRYEKHYAACMDAVKSLVDIGVRVAEYKETNRGEGPSQDLLDEWKALFFKGLPVFDVLEGGGESLLDEELIQDLVNEVLLEAERQAALNEHDFDSYLHLKGPWDLSVLCPDLPEPEVPLTVLGHVVHRLLAAKYPYPPPPVPADIPRYPVTAVLIADLEDADIAIIEGLLKNRLVRFIKTETVVNYCVEAFKQESTEETNKETEDKLHASTKKKQKKTGGKTSARSKEEEPIAADTDTAKGIQTPIKIPEEGEPEVIEGEPVKLSAHGKLGQIAFEELSEGNDIQDDLLICMIIEYLRNCTEINGWVVLNYPKTYAQTSLFEEKFSGIKMPPESPEDEEPINPLDEYRKSKLVPNPDSIPPPEEFATYLTAYIWTRKINNAAELEEGSEEESELFSENVTSLEKLYREQGINYTFYYDKFDFPTLKNLSRTIIGDMELPLKTSVELFGEDFESLASPKKKGKSTKGSKAKSAKAKKAKETKVDEEISLATELQKGSVETVDNQKIPPEPEPPPIPGDERWEYINLPLPNEIEVALASMWEAIEIVYQRGFAELFFSKRINYSHMIPYINFVTGVIQDYLRRPDCKQETVNDFQRRYNEVEEDLRQDTEVKNELHCRVSELRYVLWDMCDMRKKEAEKERRRIICESWLSNEMHALTNLFLTAVQLEVDRYVDTLQLIYDYYAGMLEKSPSEKRFEKIQVPRLTEEAELEEIPDVQELKSKRSRISSGTSLPGASKRGSSLTTVARKGSYALASGDRKRSMLFRSSTLGNTNKAAVAKILINVSTEFSVETPYHLALSDTISAILKQVGQLEAAFQTIISKEKGPAGKKSKGKSVSTPIDVVQDVNSRERLIEEWTFCGNGEIARTKHRLQILQAKGFKDLSELLNILQTTFYTLYYETGKRYEREVESVDELCKILCTAIEEETRIQQQLVLEQDNFYIRQDVLLFPSPPPPSPVPLEERILPGEFRIIQIEKLKDKLICAAPSGIMPGRAFTYMLEYYNQGGDDGEPIMPSIWSDIRYNDVQRIVDNIYGVTEYIDWRDFIIYALDLPYPSVDEILQVRRQFRLVDEDDSETVNKKQYDEIVLWFQKEIAEDAQLRLRYILAKNFLFDLFSVGVDKVNYTALLLAFCKDQDQVTGFKKAITLSTGKRIVLDRDELTEEGFLTEEELMLLAECSRKTREQAIELTDRIIEDAIQTTEGVMITEVVEEMSVTEEENLVTPKSVLSEEEIEGEIEEEEEVNPVQPLIHLLVERTDPKKQSWSMFVPFEAALSVLVAALPWLSKQPNLRDDLPSLRECLEEVYGGQHIIEARQLLNHQRLHDVLSCTTKFRIVNLQNVLDGSESYNPRAFFA